MSRSLAPAHEPPVTIVEPHRGWRRFSLKPVWDYRELVYFFVWRDLKVRYKQTILGGLWAVLQPFLMMVVFTIFFGRVLGISTDGTPKPIFYYSGLLPWTYFANAVVTSTNSIVANRGLITKVFFPRLIFPISSVVSGLADFTIAFAILIVLTFAFGLTPGLGIMLVPAFLLLAVATAFGVGLWLSALNARFRDVGYGITFIVQLWLFASPVVYSSSSVPAAWRSLYGLNPMAGVIEGFRWAMTQKAPPDASIMLASTAMVVVLVISGLWYFRRNEGVIVDVV